MQPCNVAQLCRCWAETKMPGGNRDSSKTRVAPVFERLRPRRDDWVRALLSLAKFGSGGAQTIDRDLTFASGFWGERERSLAPPVSLLSWLIRNLEPPMGATTIGEERKRLLEHDHNAIAQALALLRANGSDPK